MSEEERVTCVLTKKDCNRLFDAYDFITTEVGPDFSEEEWKELGWEEVCDAIYNIWRKCCGKFKKEE